MRRLLDLARSIPDEALPHLQQHKVRAIRPIALVLAITSVGDTVLELSTGRAYPSRTLALLGFAFSIYTLAIVATRRATGKRFADALLFLISVQFLVATSFNGWMRYGGHSELGSFAVVIPMIVSLFVPWRPRYSLALFVVTICAYAGTHAVGAPIEMPPEVFAYVSLSVCVASSVACQAQRRLWLQLENARLQVAAADRMSSLGRMTAGIAHELKTPLAAAMNGVEGLQGLIAELGESIGHPQVTAEDLREIVAEMGSSVAIAGSSMQRATQFIHAIRSQTLQMNEMRSAPFLVSDAIASTVTLATHAIKRNDIEVDTSRVDGALSIVGDAGKFGQIVTNLIGNAIDATSRSDTGKRVVVVTATGSSEGVVVTVEDEGTGVPAGLEERIFEPLFTTKANAGGTGLGLSISRDIAEGAFGGTLRSVKRDHGARFELRIPAAPPVAAAATAWAPAAAMRPARAPSAT
jgi:signal transduction histidine kinase